MCDPKDFFAMASSKGFSVSHIEVHKCRGYFDLQLELINQCLLNVKGRQHSYYDYNHK